ncbi:FAD-dependent pyridine nucleotide-disulfide oxidoreductase [Cynara cardunculus var. scolymus]|uniref:indole-3-pyruvate monooxygenase n=1 Tax=Cynara cardunculus var. scolymus TaxID=59895 RepID=A0A103XGJ0_CYNCS|nr:FAD-dependent pyridine nucleotide-disulfide oxidoreductase [Cynara cardunculus var. scolymus]
MGSFGKDQVLMGSTQKDEIFIKVHGPIIVGAGPSGIAVAACLKENGIPSLVLERSDCIASLWQYKTYNIVKLHLPKKLCELPLLGYPKNFPTYPTRDQFIAYITAYADHFKIKPMFNQTVESAVFEFERGVWRVKTQDSGYESRWLVVATGENAEALVPEIPGLETFEGPLLHASEYKNGYEFKDKRVLVVGCGNSGMEISLDLCNHKAIPFIVLVDKIILSITKHILGDIDKFGIRRPKTGPMELKLTSGRTPVVDVGALSEVVEQGVKEISKNGVKLMDGQELECDCIVLATGYKSNVPSWLKGCDFFTDKGIPKTPFPNGWKGENGLYAIGFTNRGLFGAAYDATRIGKDINKEWWAMDDFEFEFPSY